MILAFNSITVYRTRVLYTVIARRTVYKFVSECTGTSHLYTKE